MSLYTETYGNGPPLIMIHGWGMHGGLFQPVVHKLGQHATCHIIDLPGHGHSRPVENADDLDSLTRYIETDVLSHIDDRVSVLGWSMGGLIAQKLAIRNPEKVNKLILVTATPCFQNHASWDYGVDQEVLESFNEQMQQRFDKTLDRFLALQFMHSDDQKAYVKLARELVKSHSPPEPASLQAGLEILKTTNLINDLSGISCPALIINGERDSLIPGYSARFLAENIFNARCYILKGCGHAPFLSHTEQFSRIVSEFL